MTTRQIYNRLLDIKFDLIESPDVFIPNDALGNELNKLDILIRDIDEFATKESLLRRQRMKKVIHEADIA